MTTDDEIMRKWLKLQNMKDEEIQIEKTMLQEVRQDENAKIRIFVEAELMSNMNPLKHNRPLYDGAVLHLKAFLKKIEEMQ